MSGRIPQFLLATLLATTLVSPCAAQSEPRAVKTFNQNEPLEVAPMPREKGARAVEIEGPVVPAGGVVGRLTVVPPPPHCAFDCQTSPVPVVPCMNQDTLVQTKETRTGTFMVGGGVNSAAGLTGNVIVYEQNFDVYRLQLDPVVPGKDTTHFENYPNLFWRSVIQLDLKTEDVPPQQYKVIELNGDCANKNGPHIYRCLTPVVVAPRGSRDNFYYPVLGLTTLRWDEVGGGWWMETVRVPQPREVPPFNASNVTNAVNSPRLKSECGNPPATGSGTGIERLKEAFGENSLEKERAFYPTQLEFRNGETSTVPCCAKGDKLAGTWVREIEGCVIAATLAGDELKICLCQNRDGAVHCITLTTDCSMTKDGIVHGIITSVEGGLKTDSKMGSSTSPCVELDELLASLMQELVDCPFSFRTRQTSAGLMVSNLKMAPIHGVDANGLAWVLCGLYKLSKDGGVPLPKARKTTVGLGENSNLPTAVPGCADDLAAKTLLEAVAHAPVAGAMIGGAAVPAAIAVGNIGDGQVQVVIVKDGPTPYPTLQPNIYSTPGVCTVPNAGCVAIPTVAINPGYPVASTLAPTVSLGYPITTPQVVAVSPVCVPPQTVSVSPGCSGPSFVPMMNPPAPTYNPPTTSYPVPTYYPNPVGYPVPTSYPTPTCYPNPVGYPAPAGNYTPLPYPYPGCFPHQGECPQGIQAQPAGTPMNATAPGVAVSWGSGSDCPRAEEMMHQAERLFADQDYTAAIKKFRMLANDLTNKMEVRECARFLQAESLRLSGDYSEAVNTYHNLLMDFPASTHRQESCQRMYEIADYWLVDFRLEIERKANEASVLHAKSSLPNLRDKMKPTVDQEGRALEVMEDVHTQDVTGPFADRALFWCGYVNFIRGNFPKADKFFTELVEIHRGSPLRPQALQMAIQAKNNSAGGADYGRKDGGKPQLPMLPPPLVQEPANLSGPVGCPQGIPTHPADISMGLVFGLQPQWAPPQPANVPAQAFDTLAETFGQMLMVRQEPPVVVAVQPLAPPCSPPPSTCSMPVAGLVLPPCTAGAPVAKAGPVGTWVRVVGPMVYTIQITPDHLTITATVAKEFQEDTVVTEQVIVTADYHLMNDGKTMLGLITSLDLRLDGDLPTETNFDEIIEELSGLQKAVTDKPFALSMRVMGDSLVIGNVRLPEVESSDAWMLIKFLGGKFALAGDKSLPKPKVTKVPMPPQGGLILPPVPGPGAIGAPINLPALPPPLTPTPAIPPAQVCVPVNGPQLIVDRNSGNAIIVRPQDDPFYGTPIIHPYYQPSPQGVIHYSQHHDPYYGTPIHPYAGEATGGCGGVCFPPPSIVPSERIPTPPAGTDVRKLPPLPPIPPVDFRVPVPTMPEPPPLPPVDVPGSEKKVSPRQPTPNGEMRLVVPVIPVRIEPSK